MKRLLLLLAIITPMIASAIKIEKDEIDEFTGERTVITSWEHFQQTTINIRFRLQNGTQYLDFKYRSNMSFVIPDGGQLMFKADDGEIIKFSSIRLTTGGIGEGSVGLNGSGAWGIFATYTGDIDWFSSHIARLLRIYSTDTYVDKKLSEKEGKKIQELSKLFIATVNK